MKSYAPILFLNKLIGRFVYRNKMGAANTTIHVPADRMSFHRSYDSTLASEP